MLAEVAGSIMVLGGKAGGTLGVERSRAEAKLGIEEGMLSQVGQQLAWVVLGQRDDHEEGAVGQAEQQGCREGPEQQDRAGKYAADHERGDAGRVHLSRRRP